MKIKFNTMLNINNKAVIGRLQFYFNIKQQVNDFFSFSKLREIKVMTQLQEQRSKCFEKPYDFQIKLLLTVDTSNFKIIGALA